MLLAFVLVNLAIKCAWLGVSPLYNDEPFTVYWSQQPVAEILAMLATENNPPLYFLLIKVWSWLVPFEAAWLRVPAALFSSFTVVPLYMLALRLGSSRAAIVTTGIFSFTSYHYGFAHEVRAYALFTLLATTSLWLLVRARERPVTGLRTVLGLSVLNSLLIYTHFFGWLVIGLEAVLVWVLPELRCLRRQFLIGVGLTTLVFAPYFQLFAMRMGQSVGQGTWLEPPVLEEIYNMVWRWSNQPVLVVLFLLVLALAWMKHGLAPLGFRLGLVWAFLPLIGMFLVSFVVPMYLDRYLVYAAPGFALVMGLAFHALLPQTTLGNAACATPVLGMLLSFTPWKAAKRHPERVVARVEHWCADGCELLVVPSWYWLNYAAAKDIDLLKDPHPDAVLQRMYKASTKEERTIVVDATGDIRDVLDDNEQDLLDGSLPVDSTEADHNVWVFRSRQ